MNKLIKKIAQEISFVYNRLLIVENRDGFLAKSEVENEFDTLTPYAKKLAKIIPA